MCMMCEPQSNMNEGSSLFISSMDLLCFAMIEKDVLLTS